MVNPENSAAINYIRNTIKFLNYSLQPRTINAETHESILSAYLKHLQEKELKKQEISPPSATISTENAIERRDSQEFSEKKTYVVPIPAEISNKNILGEIPTGSNDREKPTVLENPQILSPTLQKSATDTHIVEVNPDISPQKLSKKILAKVLQGEIGRLYFERQQNYGKIICSQEGKIQYSIDKLSLDIFQGTINEFKILVSLPKKEDKNTQKIEIEKNYKGEQVLLRFQIVDSGKGEEGTLQVLRGKALQFYKQNKLEQMGRQALELAQRLERKLHQIHVYSNNMNHSEDKLASCALAAESLIALQKITQELSLHVARDLKTTKN
jgi:type II secretory ATPase GspE/PulE/Tfp pilus assembly ATPase PilB-like protein